MNYHRERFFVCFLVDRTIGLRHRVGSAAAERQRDWAGFTFHAVSTLHTMLNLDQHAAADALEAPMQSSAPQPPAAAPPQAQLGLQEYQLRQLATLLGSANMAALQSMSVPSASLSMPDSSAR